jgi:hypothetical protein
MKGIETLMLGGSPMARRVARVARDERGGVPTRSIPTRGVKGEGVDAVLLYWGKSYRCVVLCPTHVSRVILLFLNGKQLYVLIADSD